MNAIKFFSTVLVMCTIGFSSCNSSQPAKENTEQHDHEATYQCPMKCEGDTTYNQAGKCPKCEMDLKEVEHQH